MDEQDGPGVRERQGQDDWRPPPPSIGTPVLLMIFTTAAAMFNVAALVLPDDNEALRYPLAGLTLAPLVYGWWSAGRSRRRGPLSNASLSLVMLSVPVMPALSSRLLDYAQGRPVNGAAVAPPVLLGFVLLLLLVVVVAFFFPGDRAHPPSGERRRR